VNEFWLGVNAMGAAVIGLYFLRFWTQTRDRLFLCFALAFWVLGCNWLALGLVDRDEPQTALYAVRLLAFGLILFGIWDKNRKESARPDQP
jgi:hypothetical protein